MSEEYILERDIVYDHNERMQNIKKYYPYFKLTATAFSQFQGGKYANLDMGYILMAVLRFFIEENNFKEKNVVYNEVKTFIIHTLRRDYKLLIDSQEEEALSAYIFDRIRNEGKPFYYEYFDPVAGKNKSVRMKLIDSNIVDEEIIYFITPEAIEFYLDTKEVKDENSITVSQVLLSKLISSKNYKGGAEVVKRINSEVSRLIAKKNEVLSILSYDVFEGVKAYESFVNTQVKWFDEEQKLFVKNQMLIEEALKRSSKEEAVSKQSIEDVYHLENELKKAIVRHEELLSACTDLQKKASGLIEKAKFQKLRNTFDFKSALKQMMENDNVLMLENIIMPMLKLNIKKSFDICQIDKILALKTVDKEVAEKIDKGQQVDYIYEDEIAEERIRVNYTELIKALFDMLLSNKQFSLRTFNCYIEDKFNKNVFVNGDYYSFLIHLSQKKTYNIELLIQKPDTFFEEYVVNMLKADKEAAKKYQRLAFELSFEADEVLEPVDGFTVTNINFERTSENE